MAVNNVSSSSTLLQTASGQVQPPSSPHGILIFNINDNTSGSADALLHVVRDMLAQKGGMTGNSSVQKGGNAPSLNNNPSDTTILSITHFVVGASLLTAMCTWAKIKFLAYKSLRSGHWSAWRSEVPLQVLFKLTGTDIVTELLPDLRTYYDPGAVHDTNVFVLVRMFLADIEEERAMLQDLLWWYRALRIVHLYGILGDEEIEFKAKKRGERLELLKHCLCEWVNTCLCRDNTTLHALPNDV